MKFAQSTFSTLIRAVPVCAVAVLGGCVVAPVGGPAYEAPAGGVYVAPTYVLPAPGYAWRYHGRFGWGWHHPGYGWHRGWR